MPGARGVGIYPTSWRCLSMLAGAPQRVRGLAVLDGVYAGEWAIEAVASIQAWDEADAHRLFPVLARRLTRGGALREMMAVYEGHQGGLRLIRRRTGP